MSAHDELVAATAELPHGEYAPELEDVLALAAPEPDEAAVADELDGLAFRQDDQRPRLVMVDETAVFPTLVEYQRLATRVLGAREVRDTAKAALRQLRESHRASEESARASVARSKEALEEREKALGEYVRSTGMGDPEGVLRGTGQRLTSRTRKIYSAKGGTS